MKRRSLLSLTTSLCLASLLTATGCGGGGDDDSSGNPGSSSVVSARATLAPDSNVQVLVQWAAPLDISAQRIVEYQIYRDDKIIGAVAKTSREFRDTTTKEEFLFQRIENSGTNLIARSEKHSPLRPGSSARYQVRVLFQRIEASGVTTFAESLLNSPGALATPLVRSTLTSITPQASEALVRFPKRDDANQYQVEVSAFADFRNKTVRGPVVVTNNEGLISIPWPTDSKVGNLVYCRVGARATSDASPPLATDPNADDFIYSNVLTTVRP